MKCPRQISMPSGIQLWLEEQLEARGVDAAVYSKYILSALCSDSDQPVKPKDCRVRILIEELSEKLKGFLEKDQISTKDSTSYKSVEGAQPQSLQEKAFRYYSAFPQATSKSKADHIFPSIGPSSNVWSGKRAFGSSVGKNRTYSEGNNQDSKFSKNYNWFDENKENNVSNKSVKEKMRSRSTVKQQTPEKVSRTMAKSLDRKDDFSFKSEISKSRRLYQQSTDLARDERIQALWTCEKSFDDLTGCDQDLPMDFQQLLESPESTKMSSRCIATKHPPSFIQCGTNITSSIWSEKAEDMMECSMIGETANDSNVSLNLSKSVWSMPNAVSLSSPEGMQEPNKSNFWGTGEVNTFANNSWKVVGNVEMKEAAGKWSDVESTSLVLNDVDTFFSSMGSNIVNSLTTLNHNKEDSSFTEVIPKVHSSSFTMTKEVLNVEPAIGCDENITSKKDEEDLLTSMKTHFRPIKQETVEIVPSTAATRFPDGTTFPISNSLDKLNFHRSPGGGMYLDSDVNNKYMEFNDAEDGTPSHFVPKFRVRQNEKFCQTDEVVYTPVNNIESDYNELYFPEDEKLVRSMVEEDEVEEEENAFWGGEACIKVNGWMATWPASGIWSNEPNVQQIWCGENLWNNASDLCEPEKANNSKRVEVEEKGGDQYTQLRNEWTQEAEELLSDISQHLYLANYVDTQPPKIVELESTVVRGVSRDRKRRHWSSQLGASSQPAPSQGLCPSRPLTL